MSKGTCTTIQLLATGVIAFLSEKLGITFYLLGLLVFLMVVDYIIRTRSISLCCQSTCRLTSGSSIKSTYGC